MVSLCQNQKNKHYRIVFDDATGARRTLRLGKVAKSIAESVRGYVRNLRKAKFFNETLSDSTAHWLNDIDPEFRKRLEAAGLIDAPAVEEKPKGPTLGDFLDKNKYYSRDLGEVTGSTRIIRDQTAGNLLKFFGRAKYMAEFHVEIKEDEENAQAVESPGAAFRRFLLEVEELAESTTRKRCSVASGLFAMAVRRKLVESNPFHEVLKAPMAGADGDYVTNKDAVKILAEMDAPQRRLLFGLGRWGGLRVGSEVRRLKWKDVDFGRKRFTVHSPKTRRHQPKREVPIFPELLPLFAACAVEADNLGNPDDLVFPFLQSRTDTALRKLLDRAVNAAGLKPLSRPWQNMRASCQTDLVLSHPIQVVCAWLGNSTTVAAKHYLRTTDADFEKAAGGDVSSARTEAAPSPKSPRAKRRALAMQRLARRTRKKFPFQKTPVKAVPMHLCATPCMSVHPITIVRLGFEPRTKGL
jgi:integrase